MRNAVLTVWFKLGSVAYVYPHRRPEGVVVIKGPTSVQMHYISMREPYLWVRTPLVDLVYIPSFISRPASFRVSPILH